ncbi:CerR family C-terminal domain-containing protein [Parasulfitobacter algicola]|uniref:CerR family C-terminal domain-containing protein n=1 Tax=Parasulfitobacter algicola TaxID=2614809 RepID=A0ABX2IX52_9RHOB|nr:CerR family C-terminal domain-containing protein [Sulfitobacter algicola]NSX56711.1 CerR family C-terminal domain-containing protein [Sulfitobacter algicola]
MAQQARKIDDPRTERTRNALLTSAIRLFGSKGFQNTTMRDLAQESGANIAAINYHFGSKDNLRVETARTFAAIMNTRGPGEKLKQLSPDQISRMSADTAKSTLRDIMIANIRHMTTDEQGSHIQRFFLREVFSDDFDISILFELAFSSHFQLMAQLVSRVTDLPADSDACKIKTLIMMGQSIFLCMAQPLIETAMNWSDYGEQQLALMLDAFWLDPTPKSQSVSEQ